MKVIVFEKGDANGFWIGEATTKKQAVKCVLRDYSISEEAWRETAGEDFLNRFIIKIVPQNYDTLYMSDTQIQEAYDSWEELS